MKKLIWVMLTVLSALTFSACNTVQGITETEVAVVWEPLWTPQRISAEGRKMLGIDEEAEM